MTTGSFNPLISESLPQELEKLVRAMYTLGLKKRRKRNERKGTKKYMK